METGAQTYVVRSIVRQSPSIATISLAQADGSRPRFHAGQLITVYFPDLNASQGKPYSISSAPIEQNLSITVKAVGPFSNRLCSLEAGESLLASKPYDGGLTIPFSRTSILLAGGMGVAPFRGMLLDSLSRSAFPRTSLLFSGKTLPELIFIDELRSIALMNSQFTIETFVTQETESICGALQRRMQIDDVLHLLDTTPTDFFICGPLSFVLEQKDALTSFGVPHSAIYMEAH